MTTAEQIPGAAPAMPVPEALCRCVEELRAVCRDAWQEGLLSGCNGNASLRLEPGGGLLCMTRTGAAKGRLTAADICLLDAATGRCLANGPASSEAAMHFALYAARPGCGAVLHTHPRRLLALSLVLGDRGEGPDVLLRLPLYEADVWRARLAVAPALQPGTQELADAVAAAAAKLPPEAVKTGGAVWMEGHGLCAFAPNLAAALTLSEELEHLAAVQLLSLGAAPQA